MASTDNLINGRRKMNFSSVREFAYVFHPTRFPCCKIQHRSASSDYVRIETIFTLCSNTHEIQYSSRRSFNVFARKLFSLFFNAFKWLRWGKVLDIVRLGLRGRFGLRRILRSWKSKERKIKVVVERGRSCK
jgi:hypothetical protein